MPEGDGLGDGAGRFNERSLLASQNAPERGTGWSGLIAKLHSLEGSEAEDLNGGRQEREWAAVLGPGRKICWGQDCYPRSETENQERRRMRRTMKTGARNAPRSHDVQGPALLLGRFALG
jgi:hypothetical protein